MYVGHAGVALGAKRYAPAVTLAALIFAAYLPDWVDAALCVSGRYHDAQMLSHSVPAVLVLALLAGAAQLRRTDRGAILVVVAVVISHVLLDYITGIKPTWPGGPLIGLQVYSTPILDFVVESAVIVTGWTLYRQTVPNAGRGFSSPNAMLIALLLMQAVVDGQRLLSPSLNKC